jgi:hypothetical protein
MNAALALILQYTLRIASLCSCKQRYEACQHRCDQRVCDSTTQARHNRHCRCRRHRCRSQRSRRAARLRYLCDQRSATVNQTQHARHTHHARHRCGRTRGRCRRRACGQCRRVGESEPGIGERTALQAQALPTSVESRVTCMHTRDASTHATHAPAWPTTLWRWRTCCCPSRRTRSFVAGRRSTSSPACMCSVHTHARARTLTCLFTQSEQPNASHDKLAAHVVAASSVLSAHTRDHTSTHALQRSRVRNT